MNNNLTSILLSLTLLFCPLQFGLAQGFVDLNFESAKIILDTSSLYYPHAANAAAALPGWTIVSGGLGPDVFYNDISLGSAAISIHDTNDIYGDLPIAGNYSVFLQTSVNGVDSPAIQQTGAIPTNSQSLTFLGLVNLQITFNGQTIPYSRLSDVGFNPDYGELYNYGANISSFAGQTGTLRFTGGGILDNISFSPSPVPEPSNLAFLGLGAMLLGLLRRRKSYP